MIGLVFYNLATVQPSKLYSWKKPRQLTQNFLSKRQDLIFMYNYLKIIFSLVLKQVRPLKMIITKSMASIKLITSGLHLYNESMTLHIWKKFSESVIGVLKSLGMETKTNTYIMYAHSKQQTSSLSEMMSLSWLSFSSSSFNSPLSSMCRNKLVKSWMAFASFKGGAMTKDGAPYPDMLITSGSQTRMKLLIPLTTSNIASIKQNFPLQTSCSMELLCLYMARRASRLILESLVASPVPTLF